MRRAFWYAGAWAAATSIGVTASWFGCTVVLHGSASAPAPVLAAIRAESGPPGLTAVEPTVMAAPELTRATRPAAARTGTTPRTSRSIRPVPPGDIPTVSRHEQPPPHNQGAVPPPAAASPTGTVVLRAYQVLGGTTTLSFSIAEVRVISLDPSPGYHAYVDQSRPDELVVVFSQPGQESDLHATWDGGPRVSLTQYWW